MPTRDRAKVRWSQNACALNRINGDFGTDALASSPEKGRQSDTCVTFAIDCLNGILIFSDDHGIRID